MPTAHQTVAFLVLGATWSAAVLAGVAYYRGREPRGVVTHLLALAQTLLIAQVGLGLMLLSEHHRSPHRLHYLYGTLQHVRTLQSALPLLGQSAEPVESPALLGLKAEHDALMRLVDQERSDV